MGQSTGKEEGLPTTAPTATVASTPTLQPSYNVSPNAFASMAGAAGPYAVYLPSPQLQPQSQSQSQPQTQPLSFESHTTVPPLLNQESSPPPPYPDSYTDPYSAPTLTIPATSSTQSPYQQPQQTHSSYPQQYTSSEQPNPQPYQPYEYSQLHQDNNQLVMMMTPSGVAMVPASYISNNNNNPPQTQSQPSPTPYPTNDPAQTPPLYHQLPQDESHKQRSSQPPPPPSYTSNPNPPKKEFEQQPPQQGGEFIVLYYVPDTREWSLRKYRTEREGRQAFSKAPAGASKLLASGAQVIATWFFDEASEHSLYLRYRQEINVVLDRDPSISEDRYSTSLPRHHLPLQHTNTDPNSNSDSIHR